jgi:hypothetical protein
MHLKKNHFDTLTVHKFLLFLKYFCPGNPLLVDSRNLEAYQVDQ